MNALTSDPSEPGRLTDPTGPEPDPQLSGVRDSARQWHTLQLGALGFVGLCGVLKSDAGTDLPLWLQTAAGLLALLALAVAGVAILLVATVAWPLGLTPVTARAPQAAVRRLRLGLALTFVAVALTSLSAGAAWWPRSSPASCEVRVATASGVVCGSLER